MSEAAYSFRPPVELPDDLVEQHDSQIEEALLAEFRSAGLYLPGEEPKCAPLVTGRWQRCNMHMIGRDGHRKVYFTRGAATGI